VAKDKIILSPKDLHLNNHRQSLWRKKQSLWRKKQSIWK